MVGQNTEAPKPPQGKLTIGVLEVSPVVGKVTPIDQQTGQSSSDEAAPLTAKELLMPRENFLMERGFVGSFVSNLLASARLPENSSEADRAQWQSDLANLQKKLSQTEPLAVITQAERAILEKLTLNYPPVSADRLGQQSLQTRSHLMTLINSYFGEQTGLLTDPQQQEVKITETDTIQAAANALGLLSAETSAINGDHWLSQLMSDAYRGLLSPEEMAQYLQNLSLPGRLLITAKDLSPDSGFWQSFLTSEVGQAAEDKAKTLKSGQPLEERVGQWIGSRKTLRVLLEERLETKKNKLKKQAQIDYQNSGDENVLRKAQEEIAQLEADFYGLNKAENLNERARGFLTNLSTLYQSLSNQEPAAQKAWFEVVNLEKAADEKEKKKRLMSLLSILQVGEIDDRLTTLAASTLEKYAARGIKLGGTIGAFALLFVLMQLYTGAMSGEGSGGQ